MNDTESRQENHRTLEISVQPIRIIDVGWMAADEYNGSVHQAYLKKECAKECCAYPDELPVFVEFPHATTSMLLGHRESKRYDWDWDPVDIVVKLDDEVVFECCATPGDAGGIRFVEKAPPFLSPSDTADSKWLVGATFLKYTVWSPWKMEVSADFRFDPAKLEIPFFRIPVEKGEAPVAIARHSDVRYDGRCPALDRGDFEDVAGDETYRCHTSFTLADLKAIPQSV